jgi:hypothetical protein
MKLIDKDALVAWAKKTYLCENASMIRKVCYKQLLEHLDTIEVKVTDEVKIGETEIYLEDDGGEPPYDGKQWLDLSCMEYEIPKALFKDGDNVEILIRKIQKGE